MLDLRTQKYLHESSPFDVEILGLLVQEFLPKSVARGNRHHVIDKQAVDDEIVTVSLHENSFLTVHGGVTICFHPFRDAQMPSPSDLLGAINAFEK
jgi:hypothetical protein